MPRETEAIEAGRKVRTYTSDDLGAGMSLLQQTGDNDSGARKIVMAEAGTLSVVDGTGTEVVLADLPQWYEHVCMTRSIMAGQRAAVIVYW